MREFCVIMKNREPVDENKSGTKKKSDQKENGGYTCIQYCVC